MKNLTPLILASLKKVAEHAKLPVCEIVLSHKDKGPHFQQYSILPLVTRFVDPDKVLQKQMVQAKLCVLDKQFRASLERIGTEVTRIVLRFEVNKKPKWTIEYPPRELNLTR